MPTECSPALFDFAPVEGRAVVAGFDGGAITSIRSQQGGALLPCPTLQNQTVIRSVHHAGLRRRPKPGLLARCSTG